MQFCSGKIDGHGIKLQYIVEEVLILENKVLTVDSNYINALSKIELLESILNVNDQRHQAKMSTP